MAEDLAPKILISGATGYIGRRLKNRLLSRSNLSIRLLVRNRNKLSPAARQMTEVVEGDTFHPAILSEALAGIDTAYYLIHSMGGGKNFEERDRQSAKNFRDACLHYCLKRNFYLGFLVVISYCP